MTFIEMIFPGRNVFQAKDISGQKQRKRIYNHLNLKKNISIIYTNGFENYSSRRGASNRVANFPALSNPADA